MKANVSAHPKTVDVREYLYAWNDWIVGPVFCAIAMYLFAKSQSKPTLLVAMGLTIDLLVKGYMQFSAVSTLDSRYLPLLAIRGAAFATASVGFVWFFTRPANPKHAALNQPLREDTNPESAEQLRDSIDWPSLDLQRAAVYVDIGFLAGADHRTAFRMIFERLLDTNRELLNPMTLIAVEADRPLRPQGSALSDLPATMSVIVADAASVADVLYDSFNEHVDLQLSNESKAANLRIAFDNPEFLLAWNSSAA